MRVLLLAFLCALPSLHADEVIQVTWETEHAAAPPQLERPAADYLPYFRLALTTLPESAIVSLCLSQPAMLGLSSSQAEMMRPLVAARYGMIAQSPAYSGVRSALPYCYEATRPHSGLALVHLPAGANARTPVVLFIHGYGGSFLWYQHLLSEHFAGHVIICPVHGINTSAVPGDYVLECLRAVETRLGRRGLKPVLLGLSAGGFGACRVYTQHPESFDRMICIAAYPPEETLSKFSRNAKAAFIAGGEEPFVKSGLFSRNVGRVRLSAPSTQDFIVPRADHFFLLTHTGQTMAKLHDWLPR